MVSKQGEEVWKVFQEDGCNEGMSRRLAGAVV